MKAKGSGPEAKPAPKRRPRRLSPLWWLNILAVAALLLSYLSAYVDPAVFWPLAPIGMAYPYLLAINLFFIAWWIVFRRRRVWLPVLAILVGWGHIGEYVQLFGNRDAPANVATPFTLMSWNVRLFDLYNWTHNEQARDEIMDLIRAEDPDILCMQEFLDVDSGNPMEVKDPLLTSFRYIACADTYTVRTRGDQFIGIAIFSTWPITAKGVIRFPHELNNLCLWADVAIGTDTVRVYTAHLSSLRFSYLDYAFMRDVEEGTGGDSIPTAGPRIMGRLQNAFIRRSADVALITASIRNCTRPMVFCGDLNDTPMSYSYHELLRTGLRDAFEESGRGFGQTYIGDVPSFRIDHIMHGPRIRSWGFRTLQDELSDHKPIISNLGLVPKPRNH